MSSSCSHSHGLLSRSLPQHGFLARRSLALQQCQLDLAHRIRELLTWEDVDTDENEHTWKRRATGVGTVQEIDGVGWRCAVFFIHAASFSLG